MNRCDSLLAGLPQDPDFCVPPLLSSSSRSNASFSVNGKSQQSWGSSLRGHSGSGEPVGVGEVPGGSQEAPTSLDTPLDKILDSVIDWSKRLETGELPAAAQNTVLSLDWRPSWGSRHQASGTPPLFLPEAQEDLNKADVLKKAHSINKKPTDANSSKAKAKCSTKIPDAQKLLRCELESLKCQLQAQTKAFEFLNHSVTLLEKESCLQQIKIQQLEEVLSPPDHPEKDSSKWGSGQGPRELCEILAQGLLGLEKALQASEEGQRERTGRCLQLLAQEIRDSKKFLWEELELVREEVTFIYHKLQAQEEEIAESMVNIRKMQQTQMKCRQVLSRMKYQGCDMSNWPEESKAAGGTRSWRKELQKELGDIWSAVHLLQNSIDHASLPVGGWPRAVGLRGTKGNLCQSPPPHSWDSDSDSNPFQPPFSNNYTFSLGVDSPLTPSSLLEPHVVDCSRSQPPAP
ncbi:coiled-coil domain-containing protein 159 [Suncus etruscus]|uniref:coiled-coil domain-containing protein 159 n=1 Tax=Suncus etruscus TaxID=109475 RepID=UPI0021104513|nr:coiled-coil domain-containing protein 159 [Suncus etruscus]